MGHFAFLHGVEAGHIRDGNYVGPRLPSRVRWTGLGINGLNFRGSLGSSGY